MALPRLSLKHSASRLLALFFALLVYAHVYTEQERTADFTLPLRVQGMQSDLVLMSEPPKEVKLTLRGTGKQLVKLRVRPPAVVLDLSEARPGEVQRIISPADVLLPAGTGASVEAIQEPRAVTLVVDSLVTRNLPVQVTQAGDLARGLSLKGPIHTQPEQVLVQGPKVVVDALSYLGTEPLNLSNFSGPEAVTLAVSHDSTLTVHPSKVTVTLDLIPTEARTLVLSIEVRGAGSRVIRILPETATVHLEGPVEDLRELNPGSVRLWVDAKGLSLGLHRMTPQISLPTENIEVRAIVPSEFLVDIGA